MSFGVTDSLFDGEEHLPVSQSPLERGPYTKYVTTDLEI